MQLLFGFTNNQNMLVKTGLKFVNTKPKVKFWPAFVIRKICFLVCNLHMPFILARAMAKPLSSLMQILSRPQHKSGALESGNMAHIFHPLFCFFLFCLGKLLVTIANIFLAKMAVQDYFDKPFTMYFWTSLLMLIPMGLHFYLAYQEFVFYTFNSYYQRFSKFFLETPEKESEFIITQQNRLHLMLHEKIFMTI